MHVYKINDHRTNRALLTLNLLIPNEGPSVVCFILQGES